MQATIGQDRQKSWWTILVFAQRVRDDIICRSSTIYQRSHRMPCTILTPKQHLLTSLAI
jgi:hypothetical protein